MKTCVPSRSEWIERTKAKLDELDESLTELETRAAATRDGASERVTEEIDSVRKALDEARARWESARETVDDVWESVSQEIGTAWEMNKVALQSSIDEIRSALEAS